MRLRDDLDNGGMYKFSPDKLEVQVPFGDLTIADSIQIASFSISGQVLHKETKTGIKGVRIIVNGIAQGREILCFIRGCLMPGLQ